jgi:hypothetical protein
MGHRDLEVDALLDILVQRDFLEHDLVPDLSVDIPDDDVVDALEEARRLGVVAPGDVSLALFRLEDVELAVQRTLERLAVVGEVKPHGDPLGAARLSQRQDR